MGAGVAFAGHDIHGNDLVPLRQTIVFEIHDQPDVGWLATVLVVKKEPGVRLEWRDFWSYLWLPNILNVFFNRPPR